MAPPSGSPSLRCRCSRLPSRGRPPWTSSFRMAQNCSSGHSCPGLGPRWPRGPGSSSLCPWSSEMLVHPGKVAWEVERSASPWKVVFSSSGPLVMIPWTGAGDLETPCLGCCSWSLVCILKRFRMLSYSMFYHAVLLLACKYICIMFHYICTCYVTPCYPLTD